MQAAPLAEAASLIKDRNFSLAIRVASAYEGSPEAAAVKAPVSLERYAPMQAWPRAAPNQ